MNVHFHIYSSSKCVIDKLKVLNIITTANCHISNSPAAAQTKKCSHCVYCVAEPHVKLL